ncbi:MAG: thiamine-phosphate kinase [bacterium]|nr:thiamine-phosphate kinase [Candidatus Sumerlaeota bacterium]
MTLQNSANHATVADLGERGLLALIAPHVLSHRGDVPVGMGDDGAVVRRDDGSVEILTTDMLVEGTHFLRTAATDWAALGRKAIAVNVSDIAAMGAVPKYALVSLGTPACMPAAAIAALYKGMAAEAARWGAALIGGDTVFCPHLIVSVTMTGAKPDQQPIPLRSNCAAGQNVFVSGHLGASRAGLDLIMDGNLKSHIHHPYAADLIRRHLRPEPRVELGAALVRIGRPFAMIDISDSLCNELRLLDEASRRGFRIETDKIPVSCGLKAFCADTSRRALDYALFSGEEYELLFAMDIDEQRLKERLHNEGVETPVARIGVVTDAPEVVFLDVKGKEIMISDMTFLHFGR